MHFALPPRKTSIPPLYARKSRGPSALQRQWLKTTALVGGALLAIVFLTRFLLSSSENATPAGTPEVVIVTVIEPSLGKEYVDKIKQNRQFYADRHGRSCAGKHYFVFANTAYRLSSVFPQHLRLRDRILPQVMDIDSGPSPCHDPIPSLDLLLLPFTARPDHESFPGAHFSCHGSGSARVNHAQRQASCTAGQRDTYLFASERG